LISKKSPALYIVIVVIASVLVSLAVVTSLDSMAKALHDSLAIGILAIGSMVFIAYFWLNGTKDVVYTLWYHLKMKHEDPSSMVPRRESDSSPQVTMVYCTRNDFSAKSLAKCLSQKYDNYTVVILDDSDQPAYMLAVDNFAIKHGLEVIRRDNNIGFKAGNLNNYLRNRTDWDYFVILDSDEIIPETYINRVLDYFAADKAVGIVQANHIATRNRNPFMKRFAIGVDSHWQSYQTVKARHGFMSLLGHGAMVSRECYEATGGFPHVVAEDICLSIEARSKGYVTAFAADVICEEEYPVDYLAFKKRHSKWTQGNMEFIRNYTGVILRSSMTWFEKLDIILFTYSLPLTALFSVYVIINVIVFPAVGYTFMLPIWMLIPTVLFLFAPMLNDILFYAGKMKKRSLLAYLGQSTLLYGSMFFVSLRASITSMFGKSTFVVTPKEDMTVSFHQAIGLNRAELSFGVVFAIVAIWLNHSILPVVLIVIPAISAIYLSVSHQDTKKIRGVSKKVKVSS
jgi:cellulose synthase/poly-beta-1,6-N-acetylglucosamine synthase-like glycosyltransferase